MGDLEAEGKLATGTTRADLVELLLAQMPPQNHSTAERSKAMLESITPRCRWGRVQKPGFCCFDALR